MKAKNPPKPKWETVKVKDLEVGNFYVHPRSGSAHRIKSIKVYDGESGVRKALVTHYGGCAMLYLCEKVQRITRDEFEERKVEEKTRNPYS